METESGEQKNRFGLSRKANVAIALITATAAVVSTIGPTIATASSTAGALFGFLAIVVMATVAIVQILNQADIDRRKADKNA